MKLSALLYDIEIKKGILGRNESPISGIQYCKGWTDHAGMGISVIGAYDYLEGRYRVFCDDNFDEFTALLLQRQTLVTFNGLGFDNKVIAASIPGVRFEESPGDYDILAEMWTAAGLPRAFNPRTHGGYGLDATCLANFGTKKSGNGALAPVWWQQGKIGMTIDYCMNDIFLTKQLFDAILAGGKLIDPKNPGRELTMRAPS